MGFSRQCALLVALVTMSLIAWSNDDAAPADATGIEVPAANSPERWRELMDGEQYSEAVAIAGSWVAYGERTYGRDDRRLVAPLTRLGESFEAADDYAESIGAYERAVSIGERTIGVFAPELVAPLSGIGRVLNENERYDEAITVYLRAKNITHRNQGIFNLEQSEIAENLAESYLGQSEFSSANREHNFVFRANEDNFGDTVDLVPALSRHAEWRQRIGDFPGAREKYRRAVEIIERDEGKNDTRLIEPLLDLAHTYHSQPNPVYSGEGARALKRVADIYESQEFPDQIDKAVAWMRLGDWYLLSGSGGNSERSYAQSWETLIGVDDAKEVAENMFGKPQLLRFRLQQPDLQGYEIDNIGPGQKRLVFGFTVDARGRVRDVKLLEDHVGNNAIIRAARASLLHARYRPRFIAGEPVSTTGMRKVITFRFPQNDRQQAELTEEEQTENGLAEKELAEGKE